MFKKKKIQFIDHPFIKGYAIIKDKKQSNLVLSFIGKTQVSSHEFEILQIKAEEKGIEVSWNY